ncbi:MAG TPA: anti-sigma factor domain-containing protein [Desulfobacteria bacterium]|nr:anti-sigma factor domain-containing protein [Desulfobacteria bacterium]
MRWQTGIVMETMGRQVVIMTPQGEFRRIKMNGRIPGIGEEIRVPAENGMLARVSRTRWLAVAASIILLMIASPLLTIMTQTPEVAVAYVAIDINPSVELTVSNRNNVLEAKAYNLDGAKVLAGLDIKGSNYKKAVSQIGRKAIELGYISKNAGNTFVISLSPIPNAKFDKAKMESTLLASANEVLTDSMVKGEFKAIQVPVALRERANQKGISPAKYAVLLEAVNAGLAVTEKDMQEKSIEVAIASAGGELDQIIGQAQDEEKFEDKEKVYIALLNKNSTLAMEQAGAKDSQTDISESENDSNVEEKKDENKKPLIETVRKTGGPEGAEEENIANDGKNGSLVEPSKTTTSGAPAITVTSGQKTEPPQTGEEQNSNTAGDSNNTGGVQAPADDNTEENYMGPPVETPENETDMYILKPNF